jgi:hypothetical protein
MISCQLVDLYGQIGTCSRFHEDLRKENLLFAELLESPNGLGLFLTYVIPKLIFDEVVKFTTTHLDGCYFHRRLATGAPNKRYSDAFKEKFEKEPSLEFLFLEGSLDVERKLADGTYKLRKMRFKSLADLYFLLTFGSVPSSKWEKELPAPQWPRKVFEHCKGRESEYGVKGINELCVKVRQRRDVHSGRKQIELVQPQKARGRGKRRNGNKKVVLQEVDTEKKEKGRRNKRRKAENESAVLVDMELPTGVSKGEGDEFKNEEVGREMYEDDG